MRSYVSIFWSLTTLRLSTDSMNLAHGNYHTFFSATHSCRSGVVDLEPPCLVSALPKNSYSPSLTKFKSHGLGDVCCIVPPANCPSALGGTLSGFFTSHASARSSQMDSPRAAPCAGGPTYPYNSSVRTIFTDIDARVYAWPSRGGVIILDTAEAIDFEFLGLDPLDPPLERLDSQDAEDAFCQRLLLLGAKWWDSEARYSIISEVEAGVAGNHRVDSTFTVNKQPAPTMAEKRLIKVGWPSSGGVWVAEFDTTWAGVDEEDKLVPEDEEIGRLRMARTMDERCGILRDRFKATFYSDLKTYEGYGFFNSWESRETGEVGSLLQPGETKDLWSRAYYSFSQ